MAKTAIAIRIFFIADLFLDLFFIFPTFLILLIVILPKPYYSDIMQFLYLFRFR